MSNAFFLPIYGRNYIKQRSDTSKKGAIGTSGTKSCCNQSRGLNIYRNTLVCDTVKKVATSDFQLNAVDGSGNVWNSFDSGKNWSQVNIGTLRLESITSSSDGTRLATVQFNGDIWKSNDSGATWNNIGVGASKVWIAIASSSDGVKLIAAVFTENLWLSSDSGENWKELSGSPSYPTVNQVWHDVASSSNGNKLVAVSEPTVGFRGYVWISNNSGESWTTNSPQLNWNAVASSSDGVKLVAGVFGGNIWISVNSGDNWSELPAGPLYPTINQDWISITSSSDGSKIAAAVGGTGGYIWISNNSGMTWQQKASNRNWQSITSSTDGTQLAAVIGGPPTGGNIWISVDSGDNWNELLGGSPYPPENQSWLSIVISQPTELITINPECQITKVYKDNLSQCPAELCYSPVAKSILNKQINGVTTIDLSYNRTTQQLLQSRCSSFESNTSTCAHSMPGSKRGACCNQSCKKVIYKPSNVSFDTQGAVPSGNRIALLKYNTRVNTPTGQYLRSNYTQNTNGKKIFPCDSNKNSQRQNMTICKQE